MRLLAARLEADRAARAASMAGPLGAVAAATVLGTGVGLVVESLTHGARGLGHAFASASIHAGFLAAGWVLVWEGQGAWQRPALHGALALVAASLSSRLIPAGALAYLLVPAVLARDAGRWPARLERIGWRAPRGTRACFVGAAAGAFLGLHLLTTASLTLGYTVGVSDWRRYLAVAAYDLGVNALTAEWLFRGAIFSTLWRRWSFWPAAALSTGCALARYLLDPALPRAIEALAGATLYLTLLGLACCALRAWSGSLVPGYLATVAFFAAYRLMHA